MFRKTALRLTLFNAGIILVILVLAGISTYAGVSFALRSSAQNALRQSAHGLQDSQAFREAYGEAKLTDVGDENGEGTAALLPTLLLDSQGRVVRTVNFALADDHERDDAGEEARPTADEQAAELATEFSSARQEAMARGASMRLYSVEGHDLWVLSTAAVREGSTVGVAQVFTDVTQQNRLLGTLQGILALIGVAGVAIAVLGGFVLSLRALAPLQQAFERQRQFIAGASHQLRTPVAVIRADADALGRSLPNLDPENAQLLRDLIQEADFLSTVIQHLIVQARLEREDAPPALSAVDLAALAQETVEAMRPIAKSRGSVSLTASAEGEGPLVRANPAALRLALMALIDNAIKYNRPAGDVRIKVHREGHWGVVDVSDDGAGIPLDEQQRVFQAFYRGENAQDMGIEGAGLGLAIVRQVAQSTGGDAFLASAEGKGTTVTMRLPLA